MLSDEAKTKEQLTSELVVLRQRVTELETLETECEQTEEALRESEERLRAVVSNAPIVLWALDKEGIFTLSEGTGLEALGLKPGEVVGLSVFDIYRDLPQILEDNRRALAGETHVSIVEVGDLLYESHYSPMRGRNGEVTGMVGVSTDITAHKQAKEALRESEHKYRALFESTLDGVFVIDAETMKVVLANEAAAKIYGFDSVDDAVGASLLDFVPPEDRERVIRIIVKDMFEKDLRQVNEFRTIIKDGREIWISAVGVRTEYQGRLAGLVSIRDITERKRAEEALRKTEQEKTAILNSMSEVVVYQDTEMRVLWANRVAGESVGVAPEQLVGRHCYEIWPQRSQPCVGCPVVRVRETGQPQEAEITTPDGRVWFVRGCPIQDANDDLMGIVEVTLDITERKRAEEALRESEGRYSALLNLGGTIGEAIVMLQDTEQGNAIHTFVSNEWPRITGYSRKELLGMSFFDLLHPQHHEASLKRHKRRMSGEIIPGLFEMSIITKDGTEVPIELTSAYTIYQGQRANVAFIRDITERKQAEEREEELQQQLYLSSRLASIGELAAGVAHEISNPLTGILGFSQRLMRKSTDEEISRDLDRIHSEAQRVAKVVGNLLTFARRREPRKEYSDINDILQEALELRAYALETSNIELVTSLAPSLPKIMADFHQIQEVFLNIILNAEQAMSEANAGGKLSVKAQPTRDYIRISFADDGPGIPAEQLDKIFDPFFTTRGEKGGTGLGLSLCHGIVAEHAGRIYAKSKPGKGATFFVELPLSPVGASFAGKY